MFWCGRPPFEVVDRAGESPRYVLLMISYVRPVLVLARWSLVEVEVTIGFKDVANSVRL